jgi:UDP-N-acetylmuramoyl-L-alanyl-D-glutamate--2,6-diaminopimelate ligase
MKVIGVTGTNGKTTFARLLTAVLREAGARAGTLDTFGYWDGLEDRPAIDGLLSPPSLARSLANMNAAGASHAIVEVSSRDLSRAVLAGVELDAVCLTQVSRAHLDWHGSLHNYRQAKRRILQHLTDDGVAVLNADDAVCVEMLCDVHQPALTYGIRKPAEITAHIVEQQINEQTFVLSAGDESVGVRTEMIGEHHVYNCLAAAAIALVYDVELTTIARGLEAVSQLPGRMERIVCGQEFAVFVDAAHSPETLRACLRAARPVTSGRLICVLGADGQAGCAERQAMGRVVGAMSDLAVVTSNMSGSDDLRSICLQVRSGFADLSRPQIVVDRTAAIVNALNLARAGDTIVIAGMGERTHGMDADGLPMNDARIVRHLLHGPLNIAAQHKLAA